MYSLFFYFGFGFGRPGCKQEDMSLIHLLQGKYKYNAWKKLVEEGVTAEQAKERYVALVEELKGKYGYEA